MSNPNNAPLDSAATEAADALTRLRVLVVDDQPANRLLLCQQLEFLGVRPSLCDDGETGLRAWLETPFEVVIVDCNMPNMNGYDLSRAIRQHESHTATLPCTILGYTANAPSKVREQCLAAGMDDCLFKPIGLAALQQCLLQLRPHPVALHRHLRALTGGDIGLTRRLLEEVRSSCALDRERLSCETQRQPLIDLAHRVKGAARIVRADGVCKACDDLEHARPGVDLGPLRRALCLALDDLQQQLLHALQSL